MSRRSRIRFEVEWQLPWQIEVILCVIGLICVPFGMWWITNEITSPATMFGQILGVTVNIENIVEPFRPAILLFGLLVGWRVRCWLRRMIGKRLSTLL
jgi:hypothetical protein